MRLTTLFSIAVGVALAASCGLRAFMPLFIAGLMARLLEGTSFEPEFMVGGSFAWLKSTPALIALGVAVVAEVAADKIPALDNLLDVVQTPVRTGAGMVVCAAFVTELPTWAQALTAVVAGGGAALGVHATKSAVRLGSTVATGGTANPLLSIGEDILCGVSALLSVVFAVVAVIVAVATIILIMVFLRWAFKKKKEAPPDEPDAPQAPA